MAKVTVGICACTRAHSDCTDFTPKIVKEFHEKDNRVKLMRGRITGGVLYANSGTR